MNERPILFSASMVRAILDGRKTMTRRVVKPQPDWTGCLAWFCPAETETGKWEACDVMYDGYTGGWEAGYPRWTGRCPYGTVGSRLWVRETHAIDWEHGEGTRGVVGPAVYYRATDAKTPWTQPQWKPSIHMPRWASRITLEITGVRAERVQDISEEDAVAEGVCASRLEWWQGFMRHEDGSRSMVEVGGDAPPEWMEHPEKQVQTTSAVEYFSDLWDSINGKTYPWASNPWVWAVSFKLLKGDQA